MQKNRVLISTIGFVLQLLLFFLLARKTGYWIELGTYYIVCTALAFVYLAVIDKRTSLVRFSVQYAAFNFAAIIISSIVARLNPILILWFFCAGLALALLCCIAIYHMVRIFVPGGAEERGIGFTFEIAVTVFACCSYPLFMFVSVTPLNAIAVFLVSAALAALAAAALIQPIIALQRTIGLLAGDWQRAEEVSQKHTAFMKELWSVFHKLIIQIQEKFESFQKMGIEIKTSSEDLSTVSEQMNASLEEVSSTIQQISKGAQEQSSSITSIADSIEGLNTLTTSISSQVKMAAVSSRRSTDSAKQGMELARKEAAISKDIFEQTKFIEDKMNELRDQSTEIKKILDIIAGINEQTDLLALNAAIEAARVGEQGRGFAVVADEIRNLANETKRSSEIVETLILEINKTIQELSGMLTSEREKMTESNALASETELQFTGIVKAVDLVTDMISRINQAATNQADNTKNLVKQVEQIAQVAGDTAAATEEVSAAVQEQTASMQEFTSTAQILAKFAQRLDDLLNVTRR